MKTFKIFLIFLFTSFALLPLLPSSTPGMSATAKSQDEKISESTQALDLFLAMQERIKTISKEVNPKVVHIEAFLKVENMSIATTGSGIIADAQGHILTNYHVVKNAEKVTVKIQGHRKKHPAKIVGTDEQTDLAVLQIQPDFKLEPARFGNSSEAKTGDWVIAIGNPYGLDGTVSFGIISAIQRNLSIGDLLNEFIQTDAMIDFGSSGGPLVNMRGEVIGINSRGQGRGIGFTIPINTARSIQEKLIKEGKVQRAWLGVTIQPLDRDLAEHLGIPKTTGVIVNQVHDGSSAERAGIRPGDILTHFDGKVLEAENERELRSVSRLISQTEIGKRVKIRMLREGKTLSLSAKVLQQPKVEGNQVETQLGFHVQEITKFLYISQRLQSRKGVYVSFVEAGSVADEAKLRRGDIIQRIDQKGIDNLNIFQKQAADLHKKKRTLFRVLRGNSIILVLLKNDRINPHEPTTP